MAEKWIIKNKTKNRQKMESRKTVSKSKHKKNHKIKNLSAKTKIQLREKLWKNLS